MEVELEEVSKDQLTQQELNEFQLFDGIPIVEKILEVPLINSNNNDLLQQNQEGESSAPRRKRQHNKNKFSLTEQAVLDKFISRSISFFEAAKTLKDILPTEHEADALDIENDITIETKRKTRSSLKQQNENTRQERQRKKLPVALRGLMGEANLCFARGEKELAEKLCFEIIRQQPDASEPYITLTQIYEQDQSNREKYIELLTITAYITNSRWHQLAEVMAEQENFKQANYYYGKAVRVDPKNVEVRMKRIEVLKKLGKEKLTLRSIVATLDHMSIEEHKLIIENATWAAKKYFETGNVEQALEVMLKAYSLVPEHFQTEDINAIIELLIRNRKYVDCLNVLSTQTGIKYSCKKNTQEISDVTLPENMDVYLRAKAYICLINLNAFKLIDELIADVCNFIDFKSNAELGVLYLDIAEALMEKEKYNEALRLLDPLVESATFSYAAVWMSRAMCHEKIGNYAEAIISYQNVVQLSEHAEARYRLGELLIMQGHIEEAIEALSQNPDEVEIICPKVLMSRCDLLLQVGRIDEYLQDAYKMLLRHCPDFQSRQEIEASTSWLETKERWRAIMSLRNYQEDPIERKLFNESDITVTEDWDFFCKAINVAFNYNQFTQLQRLIFAATASPHFKLVVKEIDFMAILACIFNKEHSLGYDKIRLFIKNYQNSARFWNLFNLVTYSLHDDTRSMRLVQRIFEKENKVHPMVYMLIANYHCNSSNSNKVAINCYDEIYNRYKNPLIALMLGVLYLQVANMRCINRKQSLVLQSINYFEIYANTREPEAKMEILYNKARYHHQIGMTSIAKDFYQQALVTSSPIIESDQVNLDLRKTIAFNLSLIYKCAGNFHMARKILYDQIVI